MTKSKRCAIVDEHPEKRMRIDEAAFAPCKLNNESITVVEETAEVSTFESAGELRSGSEKRKGSRDRAQRESPFERMESDMETWL